MGKTGTNRKKPEKKSDLPRGQISLQQKEALVAELRQYFIKGYSAYYTIMKTGHAKDTVYTYFKEWTEELVDKTDFVEVQKEAKVRLVASLDKRIEVYETQIDRLTKYVNHHKMSPTVELALTQANRALTKLHLDKATVLVTPTLDITLASIIKERYGITEEQLVEISKVNPEARR